MCKGVTVGTISDIDVAKLMQHLSIFQATSLIVGVSPSSIYLENYDSEDRYNHAQNEIGDKFRDVLDSVIHAIKFNSLKATIAYEPEIKKNSYGNYNDIPSFIYQDDLVGDWFKTASINIHNTFINRHDLKSWLLSHDVRPYLLFNKKENDSIEYLDKNHKGYVPKLALCIRAWQSSQFLPDGVAVGKWLEEYIKDHAGEFDLSNSHTMVKTLTTICNWNSNGGNKASVPYLRENIPKDYSELLNKNTDISKHSNLLPELKDFIGKKSDDVDDGDIPF